MSELYLVYKNLFRKKLRAFLLSLAIFVAFLIFGALVGVNHALDLKPRDGEQERMVTLNKVNFTQFIPYSYYNRIRGVEGVENAFHQTWFGAFFREPKNFIVGFAVNPEEFIPLSRTRYGISDEQAKAWLADRTGMLVGRNLADKFGWKVGDVVPISSNIYTRTDGTRVWPLKVALIAEPTAAVPNTNALFMNYEYLNESRSSLKDQISQVIFVTKSPEMDDVVAKKIDEGFANSSVQTRTTTSTAFTKSFVAQLGNVTLIITAVVGAAFVSILLVIGNTMIMAIRERTREIAVMKTIGFSAARIFRMIILETVMLSFVGGILGLALGMYVLVYVSRLGAIPLPLDEAWIVALQGLGLMVLLGLVTGFIPAYSAMRLNIVTGLGRD